MSIIIFLFHPPHINPPISKVSVIQKNGIDLFHLVQEDSPMGNMPSHLMICVAILNKVQRSRLLH